MTATALRGDACPVWCGGEHDDTRVDSAGDPVLPQDSHRTHGLTVDEWESTANPNAQTRVAVSLERLARDFVEPEATDRVLVWSNSRAMELTVDDARRLASALVVAAERMSEGT